MITRERKAELLKNLRTLGNEIGKFIDDEIAALENQELFEQNGTLQTALELAEDRAKEKLGKLNDAMSLDFTDDDKDYLESVFEFIPMI